MIGNQRCADTRDLVCTDRSSNAAATNSHAALHFSRRHGARERHYKVWIIVACIQAVGPEIDDLVARSAQVSDQLYL